MPGLKAEIEEHIHKISEQAEEIRTLQESRLETNTEEVQTESEQSEDDGFIVDKKLIEVFLQMCIITSKASKAREEISRLETDPEQLPFISSDESSTLKQALKIELNSGFCNVLLQSINGITDKLSKIKEKANDTLDYQKSIQKLKQAMLNKMPEADRIFFEAKEKNALDEGCLSEISTLL